MPRLSSYKAPGIKVGLAFVFLFLQEIPVVEKAGGWKCLLQVVEPGEHDTVAVKIISTWSLWKNILTKW